MTNKKGQADRAIEFIPAGSELAESIDKQYWVIKDGERQKYRPGAIVRVMKDEGYTFFTMHHHTLLWKRLQARNRGKGYGAEVVPGQWLWYDRWVEEVREYCRTYPTSSS